MSKTYITEVPNMDTISEAELTAFHDQYFGVRPIGSATALFPDKPKGFVKAYKLLRGYSANKGTAISLRLEGRIETAMQYESICEWIYGQLPEYAKW